MSVDVGYRVGAHRLVTARPRRSRLFWLAHVVGGVGTLVAVSGVAVAVLTGARPGVAVMVSGSVLASGAGMLAWWSAHRHAKQ